MNTRKKPTGEDFKDARRNKNLTQAALAAQFGIDVSTVARWEKALNLPMAALAAYKQIAEQSVAAKPVQRPTDPTKIAPEERTEDEWFRYYMSLFGKHHGDKDKQLNALHWHELAIKRGAGEAEREGIERIYRLYQDAEHRVGFYRDSINDE